MLLESLHAAPETGAESMLGRRGENDLTAEVEIPAHAAARLTIPGTGRAA